MPSALSCRTTFPKFDRWISGDVFSSSSFMYAHWVYSRKLESAYVSRQHRRFLKRGETHIAVFHRRDVARPRLPFSGPDSPRPSSSLIRTGPRARGHYKAGHSRLRVEAVLLAEPRVDNVNDPINSDARLGDVRGEDNFARALRRGFKNLGLHVRRQSRIDWADDKLADPRAQHPRRVSQ
ncbi:MAG: hypothetical protein BJ554DRAFT_861 [Olpidium bornovanus]|uniref:Uncharacterized protein n=1 Tax=Olpidium bornovanus TaxID=278681 RepID=A0A8H8DHW3_9FUNG|nr:MAG: hypothetical protein BJ554DRAFT_861 [Olpidium bornovanus]